MTKPWIAFMFILVIALLLLSTPYLFYITRELKGSGSAVNLGSEGYLTMTELQKRPVLDWTGLLTQKLIRVSWGSKHFDLPWTQQPYSIKVDVDNKGNIKKSIITPDNIVLTF